MAADVVEGAKVGVVASDDDGGLARDVCGEKCTFFSNLVEATGHLPALSKNGRELQIVNARIAIPGRRDRRGPLQRMVGVVQVQDFVDALVHGRSWMRAEKIGRASCRERV